MDSILIDEARTPLIISGQAEKPSEKYIKAGKLAGALARDVHYTVDEKQRNVLLTEDGCACVQHMQYVAVCAAACTYRCRVRLTGCTQIAGCMLSAPGCESVSARLPTRILSHACAR